MTLWKSVRNASPLPQSGVGELLRGVVEEAEEHVDSLVSLV